MKMISSPYVRKSLLSLNNWNFAGANSSRKERSNSGSSCKTTSALAITTYGIVDFWSKVSQQMAYIDGSTRSPSLFENNNKDLVPSNEQHITNTSQIYFHKGNKSSESFMSSYPNAVSVSSDNSLADSQRDLPSSIVSINVTRSSSNKLHSCEDELESEFSLSVLNNANKQIIVESQEEQECRKLKEKWNKQLTEYSVSKISETQSNKVKMPSLYKNVFTDDDEADYSVEFELLQSSPNSTRNINKKGDSFGRTYTMETASVGRSCSVKRKIQNIKKFCSLNGNDREYSQPRDMYVMVSKKASSWEESEINERRQSLMAAAVPVTGSTVSNYHGVHYNSTNKSNINPPISSAFLMPAASSKLLLVDKKDLRYYFQHPYPRLFVTYFVIFCNFLLFAEDPISHSHTESDIPVVGNVFSFVLTKYPPQWRWTSIKVLMWILAVLCGMVLGKLLIHGLLFNRLLRLKMFRDDQGSWMTMFFTVIVSLYVFSHAYNLLLLLWYENCSFQITSQMGVTNASVMKAAACGTWLGDLITALMVTDMMLQDNLYPQWAACFRLLWRRSNIPRILIFWVGSIVATSLVVTLIVSDWISWDHLNHDFVATTELSRAFLASFILVMDLLIVMQDWDFPHFTTTLHVNLPGFSVATLTCKCAEVDITGKWFNYGIIVMVMLLDLNMWKNQIFYHPRDFGQYTGPDDKIRTVNDQVLLSSNNVSYWSWESRSRVNPDTQRPYYEDDMQMNSRFMDYPLSAKWTAFIPSVIGLILFIILVSRYGRFPPNQIHQADRSSNSCRGAQSNKHGSSC